MIRRIYINQSVGEAAIDIPDTVMGLNLSEASTWSFHLVSSAGKGNYIFLGNCTDLSKLQIKVKGSNNSIYIGSNCRLKGSIDINGNNHNIFIGYGTTFNNVKIICKGRGGIYLGRDCMLSSSIEIRTSDGHSVIDTTTKKKVNLADGVYIGDHVWIAKGALIQKGSTISSDNIIGYGSLVKGAFNDTNTIIAGIPAKVVQLNRTWSRMEAIKDNQDSELFAWKQQPQF